MSQGELTFFATPGTIAASVGIALVAIALAVAAWRKKGGGVRMGVLEAFRLLIIAAILVTLNQPEWVTETEPERRPVVAVLWDASRSMETADVGVGRGDGTALVPRADWVAERVDPALWAPVEENADVVISPFSTPPDPRPPEPGSGGTDGVPDRGTVGNGSTDLGSPLAETLERHETLRAVVLLSD